MRYTKATLPSLLDTYAGRADKAVSLTPARISYLQQHPIASEQDILHIAVFDGNKLISYVNLLPDIVLTNNGKERINWLSAWWTDPAYRATGIGADVLIQAREDSSYSCISSFNQTAGKMFKKLDFFQSYGFRLRYYHFFNVNHQVLRDFGKTGLWQLAASLAHPPAELFKQTRLNAWHKKQPASQAFRLEQVTELDAETAQLIESLSGEELCIKSREMLNWKISNPRFKPNPQTTEPEYKSYFYNSGNNVQQMNFKLYWSDTLCGFISLVITDGLMTLPYVYCQTEHWDKIPLLLIKLCRQQQVDVILTNDSRVSSLIERSRIPGLFRKIFPVEVIIDSALQVRPGLLLQDGDGS